MSGNKYKELELIEKNIENNRDKDLQILKSKLEALELNLQNKLTELDFSLRKELTDLEKEF